MSKFNRHIVRMPRYLEALIECSGCTVCTLPRGLPKSGVYLFCEGGVPLYVGRTRRLRKRVKEHCYAGSKVGTASFAVLLAREEADVATSYRVGEGRAQLVEIPEFSAAFARSKARVAQMALRYVEIADPIDQALFEVYAALELECRYNGFDTH